MKNASSRAIFASEPCNDVFEKRLSTNEKMMSDGKYFLDFEWSQVIVRLVRQTTRTKPLF